jgi:hypothetical protein
MCVFVVRTVTYLAPTAFPSSTAMVYAARPPSQIPHGAHQSAHQSAQQVSVALSDYSTVLEAVENTFMEPF